MEYITTKGETWDQIAYSVYGDEELIAPIMEANRKHIETTVFESGVKLTIPDIERTDESIFMPPWRV